MTLEFRPLSDALGAEVVGGDFTKSVTAGDVDKLKNAFLKHHLLCLRSDPLSAKALFQVASYFGTPFSETNREKWVDEIPEISRLESTYKTKDAKPKDLKLHRGSGWHTDHSFKEYPPKATVLHAHEIPSQAGQTRFCNTRKAYEDLPDSTKRRLKGLMAVHSYDTVRAPARAVPRTAEEIAETPDVVHPLIRTHDETGAKAIFFNGNRTDRVVGLPRAASDEILDLVYGHMTQDQYRYDHDWSVGDIVLWDNRCLVHSVNIDFPVGEPRVHLRTLIKGSRPQ